MFFFFFFFKQKTAYEMLRSLVGSEMCIRDRYEGYDLNKDGIGDVPYRPVSLYSMVAEDMPYSIMLYRSFMVMLLERSEKAIPGITPVDLKDDACLLYTSPSPRDS